MQGVLPDEVGPEARQVTLWKLGKAMVKQRGDDKIKYPVAEKLQPLVVGRAKAAMRQRGSKAVSIGEYPTCRQSTAPFMPTEPMIPW